ncbi:MAG TPA: hypothetical protein VFU05_11785 [Cyclobacteriaceae bacterium]|nr:hypothetical protein [Cyclobacteriaceae bacterium]
MNEFINLLLQLHLIVYDQLGRKLINEEFFNSSSDFELSASVAPGVCFIKATSGNRQQVAQASGEIDL